MENYGRKRRKRPASGRPSLSRLAVALLLALIALELILMGVGLSRRTNRPEAAAGPLRTEASQPELAKKELASLIGSRPLVDNQAVLPVIDQHGRRLFVRSTLRPELQARCETLVSASRASQAALVALDPDTGEVLALAGYRDDHLDGQAALAGSFPAASLFKIVTAAAALEKAELSADSQLAYDGGKHTLYKNNVARTPDRGRQTATLKKSFAESINTVFGKLGAYTVGQEDLADFAGRFGFNRDLAFEMPVETSSFSATEADDFRLAELASGFNRQTTISPLHGALMAAAVVAGGSLPEPRIVREVFDRENRIYYRSAPGQAREIISPATAGELARLMRSAVEEGTGRKVIGAAVRSHPVLSRLIVGGKSGTINDLEGRRVDWFVAWAAPRPGSGCQDRLALSAVVIHNDLTTTTSQKMVREALAEYYRGRLTPLRKQAAPKSALATARTVSYTRQLRQ